MKAVFDEAQGFLYNLQQVMELPPEMARLIFDYENDDAAESSQYSTGYRNMGRQGQSMEQLRPNYADINGG